LLKDSYSLHEAKCREILSPFETRLKKLNKKLARVGAATEDWAGADTIRASLSQELELVERGESQLKQRRRTIDYYLSNPDKIPQDLRTSPKAATPSDGETKPNENDRA